MKKSLWLTLVFALAAATAMAQNPYPGPDSMGFYASTDGSNVEPCVTIPLYVPTDLYLAVTNPSTPEARAWEATVTDIPHTGAYLGDWGILGNPVPVIQDNGDGTHSYAVGYSVPLVPNASGFMGLMKVTLIVLQADVPLELYVTPYPGSQTFDNAPGYVPNVGIYRPCTVAPYGSAFPSMLVNDHIPCDYPTESESLSWGQVKSLY